MTRLTLKDIEAAIAETHYIRPDIGDRLLTICILVMRNGFKVVAESACADPAIFDEEMGKDFARSAAIEKAWALEGYLLKQRMHDRAGQGVGMTAAEADAIARANYVASFVGASIDIRPGKIVRAPRAQELEAADSMFGLAAAPAHTYTIHGSPFHEWIDSKMCTFIESELNGEVRMVARVLMSRPYLTGLATQALGPNGKITEFGRGQLREAAMRRLNENVNRYRRTGATE